MIAGWVPEIEIKFISLYMDKIGTTGKILEVGSSFGRVFDYLHQLHANWNYTAVDPWELDGTRLQNNWSMPYHSPGNRGEIITKKMFNDNCPYATSHQMFFEEFVTNEKFDIISIGCMGKQVNWNIVYKNALTMLTPSGYIVGRDYYHHTHGATIQLAVNNYRIIDRQDNSFVITNNG